MPSNSEPPYRVKNRWQEGAKCNVFFSCASRSWQEAALGESCKAADTFALSRPSDLTADTAQLGTAWSSEKLLWHMLATPLWLCLVSVASEVLLTRWWSRQPVFSAGRGDPVLLKGYCHQRERKKMSALGQQRALGAAQFKWKSRWGRPGTLLWFSHFQQYTLPWLKWGRKKGYRRAWSRAKCFISAKVQLRERGTVCGVKADISEKARSTSTVAFFALSRKDVNRLVRYKTSSLRHITRSFSPSLSYRSLLTWGVEETTVDDERQGTVSLWLA